MEQSNEKILMLKERYLRLTDYDVLAAEMLSLIDRNQDWLQLSHKDFLERMVFSASIPTLRSRLESLEEKGLIQQQRSKPNKYKVSDDFQNKVAALGMKGIDTISFPVDQLINHMQPTFVEIEEVEVEEVEEVEKPKKKKKKYYDWKHYAEISTEEWRQAKTEGTFPGKENANTLLLGAYLLGMKRKHNIEVGLTAADFGGKYGKLAKEMLAFFTMQAGGDDIKGFNQALDWIKEFIHAPRDSFPGKSNWPIQMAFSRDVYRQHGSGQFTPKTGKKINDTGTVVMRKEDREQTKITIGN